MLYNIKKTLTVILVLAAAISVFAQDTRSGYFVDDFTFRFQMNPAMGNSRGFVTMPGLGNLNLGLSANIGVKSFLYNLNGRTTTFLNPGIMNSEAMGNFKDINRLSTNNRFNIFGVGFKAFGGYNTLNVSARAGMNVRIPKAIFSFLKEGISNRTYDLSGFGADAMGYAEVSLGHSRNITPEIRVGANVKFLVGATSLNANLKEASLTLNKDSWNIYANADIHASMKGMRFKTEISDATGKPYVTGLEGSFNPLNGMGLALDLGAVYSPKILSDWEFSAALLDFGFINWSEDLYATTDGETFRTDAYTFNVDDNALNSFDNELDKMKNDLARIYELRSEGDLGHRTQMLHTSFNIGARYALPVYRKLTFGLLNTTCLAGRFSNTDFRLSANIAPCKVFSASVSATAGTYGTGFGWLLNLHAPGFNLFLGQNNTFFKLAKPGIPMSSVWGLNLGINFLLK